MTSKETLRMEARKHRRRMSPIPDEFYSARDSFLGLIDFDSADIVGCYWPIESEKEFDVHPIIEELQNRNIRCALPHTHKNTKILDFIEYKHNLDEIESGPFGLHQPKNNGIHVKPTILLIPLLAFDQKGRRLGYGGGYYDATMSKWMEQNNEFIKIGIGFAQQACLFKLPEEQHDIRLDVMITPKNVYDFSNHERFQQGTS